MSGWLGPIVRPRDDVEPDWDDAYESTRDEELEPPC